MESGEKYARAHSVLEQSTKALGTKLQDVALGTSSVNVVEPEK